jgi:homoserine dehydrogenase
VTSARTSSEIRVALIGFGNVGQGFAEIVRDRRARGDAPEIQIIAVCSPSKGSIADPDGIDPGELLEAVRTAGTFDGIAVRDRGWDAATTIERADADTIVEVSTTDLTTGEPALSHARAAIASGGHFVTTNKGPIALAWHELRSLAADAGVGLGIEGTVMSGTPVLRLGTEYLADAGIRKIEGILNGTTNYILSRMAEGREYADALREAQVEGYAEADPSGDVDGWDAAAKVVILANVVMGAGIRIADVDRTGIGGLTRADVAGAQAAGGRLRLVATIEREGETVRGQVRPLVLPTSHPLASVSGVTNAVTFSTERLGDVTLIGPGAGRIATGQAVLADVLAVHATKRVPSS